MKFFNWYQNELSLIINTINQPIVRVPNHVIRKIVLITGAPFTGKTTLIRRASIITGLPLFIHESKTHIDEFIESCYTIDPKIILFDNLDNKTDSVGESIRLLRFNTNYPIFIISSNEFAIPKNIHKFITDRISLAPLPNSDFNELMKEFQIDNNTTKSIRSIVSSLPEALKCVVSLKLGLPVATSHKLDKKSDIINLTRTGDSDIKPYELMMLLYYNIADMFPADRINIALGMKYPTDWVYIAASVFNSSELSSPGSLKVFYKQKVEKKPEVVVNKKPIVVEGLDLFF